MRKIYIFSLVALACTIIGLAFAEQMTLSTYYPAPYGIYNDMVAMNSLGIGTTNPSDGTASGGEQLKLDVEGAVGATHYCDADGNNCAQPPLEGANNVVTVELTQDITTLSLAPVDTGVSASITTTGGPVMVVVDVGAAVVGDEFMWMRVLRDSTVIGGGPEQGKAAVAWGDQPYGGFTIIDRPPAGTYTYKVQYWVRNSGLLSPPGGHIYAVTGSDVTGHERLYLHLIEL